jgi:uncharacterized membrane protein (Fun14 family)
MKFITVTRMQRQGVIEINADHIVALDRSAVDGAKTIIHMTRWSFDVTDTIEEIHEKIRKS